jgi:hypothetical protein
MNARGLTIGIAFVVLGTFAQAVAAMPVPSIDGQTHVLKIAEDAPAAAPEAPTPADSAHEPAYIGNEPLESCMDRWDPGTHMTKEAWRTSCQRIRAEREPYVKGK